MDKNTIIYYLQHPEISDKLWETAEYLEKERLSLVEHLEREIIYTGQVKVSYSTPVAKTYKYHDVGDTIESTEKMLRKYREELNQTYKKTIEEIAMCKRINLIYKLLSIDDQKLLSDLYIEKIGWKAVEIDSGINHRILVRKVNDIFNLMCLMYDASSITDVKLAKMGQQNKKAEIEKQKKAETIKGQTTLYDFLGKEEQNEKKE